MRYFTSTDEWCEMSARKNTMSSKVSKITVAQRTAIRDSLQLYFDSDGCTTGYLRFCPLSTQIFPHGLSIGVRTSADDIERSKDKVTDFLVEAFECLLSSTGIP
jgi:hypothetical protein